MYMYTYTDTQLAIGCPVVTWLYQLYIYKQEKNELDY